MKTLLLRRWLFFLALVVLSGPFARAQVGGPGSALNLDGATGYAQAPSGVWSSNDFTVEGWVYVRSYNNWSRLFDVDLPLANWVNLGIVSNVSPGLFQFTTVISSNSRQQFFKVVWP